MAVIEAVRADITVQEVDAIVNAANPQLFHGGGVALALAKAGGPRFLAASAREDTVPTGTSRATEAGDLPCRVVIHTVGPVYNGDEGEAAMLYAAYRSAMKVAQENECRSVAFPSVSTGIYRFPLHEATDLAIQAIREALPEAPTVELVRFCLFSERDLAAYQRALDS